MITYRDPDTGHEFREHRPRMRVEAHGPDADGVHRYTFTEQRQPPPGLTPLVIPDD